MTRKAQMLPGSEFGYRPDGSLTKPEVQVWIEKNKSGSWELFQTVSVQSGTKKVTFPAKVTAYRTVIETNQAACKLAVWPKVTILPTAHVLELAEARLRADCTFAVLKNEVKEGRIRYKGDRLLNLTSVKAKRDPADSKLKKLSSSMYTIRVVAPGENKVRVYGSGKNYTGYVTVIVTN